MFSKLFNIVSIGYQEVEVKTEDENLLELMNIIHIVIVQIMRRIIVQNIAVQLLPLLNRHDIDQQQLEVNAIKS